ncbi:hypothetical protein [endosymbiont GvMRE of Glomus versiforme]|uniref:hypothetical protein n=1 Tax=endosymbiont GvMRE of Glomus versiforme TaxID=2039283 RepID=UPI0011C46075|nr:hypothetical protein [endosymbiont GvMRE of Glomus versiforme]
MEKLPHWEKLSIEKKNELKNDCKVSQPQQFLGILEKAKKLLAKKIKERKEPEPKNPDKESRDKDKKNNNPNPKTNEGEVNKPTNDWATKIDWTAIKPTQKEKEYVRGQILPISSVGTEYRDCYKLDNMLPRGSALLTEAGKGELKNNGIESIIHAAPGSTAKEQEDEYHPIYKGILRAIQNSIILAERENYDKIAIPFIRGDFWDMFDDIEATAKAIIYGSLNQREKLKEIIFVLSPDKKQDRNSTEFKFIDYFKKYFKEYQREYPDRAKFGRVIEGDIRDFSIHRAKVIVNDANMEMEWADGVSELIRQKINNYQEIQNKAQELIGKFNSSLSSPSPTNNNQPKLEFEVWFASMFFVPKNYPANLNDYCGFTLLNQLPGKDCDDKINWFIVSRKHPVVSKLWSESKMCYSKNHPYKLTILQKDRNKEIFEVGDFFELEPKK